MKNLWLALLLSLGFLAKIPAIAGTPDLTDIEIQIIMDRNIFAPGEPVEALVSQCNPTDEVITQFYSCPGCHDRLTVVDNEGNQIANCGGGGILVVTVEIWQPGECKTRSYSWSQLVPACFEGDQVADGSYQFQHIFEFSNPAHELITEGPSFVISSGAIAVPSLSAAGLGLLASILIGFAVLQLRRFRMQ